jgi:hypothetical protein
MSAILAPGGRINRNQPVQYFFCLLINEARYRDLNCLLARACFNGGNLRITPNIAAMALWLYMTCLSKIRF